jgi:hypothetical protein
MTLDITEFSYGETLTFTIAAKDRDGSVITTPGSQTLTLWIGNTLGGAAALEFNSSPEVVLSDAGTGTWLVSVPYASYSSTLSEGRVYYYNLTTKLGSDDPILQKSGKIRLQAALDWV